MLKPANFGWAMNSAPTIPKKTESQRSLLIVSPKMKVENSAM
jgi:hypothetical protein